MVQVILIWLRLFLKINNKLAGTLFIMLIVVCREELKDMYNLRTEKRPLCLRKWTISWFHKFISILVKIVSILLGMVILVNSEWISVVVLSNQHSQMVLFIINLIDITTPPAVTPTPKPPVTETKEYLYL